MRTIVISGRDGTQRYEVSDEDFRLQRQAVSLTVEAHNSVASIEDRWVWEEWGPPTAPTIESTV